MNNNFLFLKSVVVKWENEKAKFFSIRKMEQQSFLNEITIFFF